MTELNKWQKYKYVAGSITVIIIFTPNLTEIPNPSPTIPEIPLTVLTIAVLTVTVLVAALFARRKREP